MAEEVEWKDDGSLPLDKEGGLPFYFLDAHEEANTPHTVYLFGKVHILPYLIIASSLLWQNAVCCWACCLAIGGCLAGSLSLLLQCSC